jgi:hypothetical protein
MNKFKLTILLFFTLLTLIPTITFAESWGILAGMHKYVIGASTSASTPESNSDFSQLYGIALYTPKYPVEFDILYTIKKIDVDVKQESLQFPFFFRAEITKALKLGVGGFFDYNLLYSVGTKNLDMGPALSLQYQIQVGNAWFVLDARYLYGVVDIPGTSRDINFLAGFVFK